jgi:hypothetical protein
MLAFELAVQGGPIGLRAAAMALLLTGIVVEPGFKIGVAEPFGQRPVQISGTQPFDRCTTVDGATPVRRAISRTGTLPTDINRKISRIWRMVVLSAGMVRSFGCRKGTNPSPDYASSLKKPAVTVA